MGLLANCWVIIIESVVIPDGNLKWFYLSFHIHPAFVFVCLVFMWLKFLKTWLLYLLSYPLKLIYFLGLCVFRFFTRYTTSIFSSTKVTNVDITNEEFGNIEVAVQINYRVNQLVESHSISTVEPVRCKIKLLVIDDEKDEFERNEDEGVSADQSSESVLDEFAVQGSILSIADIIDSNYDSCSSMFSSSESSTSVCSSNSLVFQDSSEESSTSICSSNILSAVERQVIISKRDEGDGEDQESAGVFYKGYCERMGWFDILSYDRTCGISAVLNKQLETSPSIISFESINAKDFGVLSWDKMARKRLLKSIEGDFELVYVGQTCSSWEALHRYYKKVKDLDTSGVRNHRFNYIVAGEFQRFQVLLERFLEDERFEGKRVWNYVRGRFAANSLLQVPKLSGSVVEENEEEVEARARNIKQVLRAIEKCIETFWVFVETDNHQKPWWKLTSLCNFSPVEDPRDVDLLSHLTRNLQKKEIWLKDLQGKKKCWFRKVTRPVMEESEKMEMLFTMIDMKLVSRVLQMSVVSSSQLKWCQEKLDSMQFNKGKIFRTGSCPLFPPS